MKHPGPNLKKKDYFVRELYEDEVFSAKRMIREQHYSKGCSHTHVFMHGLFKDMFNLVGVAMWLPPTKVAAKSVWPDWTRVLGLTRLVVDPIVPRNGASFLLGRAIKLISNWDCLLTYADEREGHIGVIYKATNWTYLGEVEGAPKWVDKNGKQVSKKATRSRSDFEMMLNGYIKLNDTYPKHKYMKLLEN